MTSLADHVAGTPTYAFTNAALPNDSAETIKELWLVVSPILLVVGLVGNSLVLAIMTRQVMRGTSTCVYMVAMAALDIGVLLFGLIPEWLTGASITDVRVCNENPLHTLLNYFEMRRCQVPYQF